MLTYNLRLHYKDLAHRIIQKAKKEKVMTKSDYEDNVLPYLTLLRYNRLTREEVSNGFKRSRIKII